MRGEREVFMTHSPCSFVTRFMFLFLNLVEEKSFFTGDFVNILFAVNISI